MVRGCSGGGVGLRGGDRENGFDVGGVDDGTGVSKKENGSDGSCVRDDGCDAVAGNVDSKNEKSASAQESAGAWTGVAGCAVGVMFEAFAVASPATTGLIGNDTGSEPVQVENSLLLPLSLSLGAAMVSSNFSALEPSGISTLNLLSGVE